MQTLDMLLHAVLRTKAKLNAQAKPSAHADVGITVFRQTLDGEIWYLTGQKRIAFNLLNVD